jgi:pilus assembly protein Flp/PilA
MLKLYTKIHSRLATTERDDEGAAMVEYGLLVSLIAVAVIAAVTAIGVNLRGIFETIAGAL